MLRVPPDLLTAVEQTSFNLVSRQTWCATKSTTYSPSSLSYYTNNSNSSSTSISYSSPSPNSSPHSRLVRNMSPSHFTPLLMRCLPHIGFIFTYVAPLAFVLCVTMGKEAYDDYKRHLRDREANSQKYLILVPPRSHNPDHGPHTRSVPSSTLRVGDLVVLEKNQRVPADMVLLRTSDPSGTCFIRTDQLDGETDWKLRVAVPATQKLGSDRELMMLDGEVYGEFCARTCAGLCLFP